MDGESDPSPAVAEEAGERVEPMEATPSPQPQTTPASEEAGGEAVSMETEDGATEEGGAEDNEDDDVVLVGEEASQPTAAAQDTPSAGCQEPPAAAAAAVDMSTAAMPSLTSDSPGSSNATAAEAPQTAAPAEPIVIDDEEEPEPKDASPCSPAPPGGSSPSRSPGALSSTEPDSEIRIASVTTLGSGDQKEDPTALAVDADDDHQEDMNLMITSVTSLQGGEAAVTEAAEGQAEENGLQISSAFSLNPDTPPGRPTASFNPGRGSGPVGQLAQNGDTGTHNRADSWISQSASVPRSQKQTGVDSPSPATSLPKPPGQSSSSGSQPQPRTVKVTCANCKKPLKKGQTAYQRKGSTHLFCSTNCLSAFSHKPAPKKSCTMCKKDITNMKGTIVAQVDSSESFQEFCSTGCLGAYENKQNPPKSGVKSNSKCTVCGKLTEIRHEVSFKTVTHKICSDACFNVYRRANGLIMNCCEQCGDYLPNRASANHFLLVDGQQKRFCCHNCIRDFKQAHSKLASCWICKTLIKTGEVLHSLGTGGVMHSFCSVNCMNKGKLTPATLSNTEPTCHFCKRNSLPQYQATLPEGNVLNFCSSQCVTKFQNAALQPATNGQTPLSADNAVQLKCNYCRGAFSLKPEILEWEDKVYQFCSKACCEDYKKLHCIVTFCEFCQEEKTLHETVQFSGVKRPFCSEGCKLLFKQDFIKRLGLKCVSCNHCNQLCKRGVTQQLGGMTRDFCGETCAKKFHDWYFKAARCDCCKVQGNLTESVMWRAEMKHFCDQDCLLKFYCQQNEPIMVTQKGPENSTLGYDTHGTKLGLVNQGTVAYPGGGLMRDVKNKAVLCKPLTLTKATYCKPHMQSKHLQTDVDDGVKREYVPVPIPVPVFIPVPMNMYSQVTPTPLSIPVPLPVPVFLPTTLSGAEQIVETISQLKKKESSEQLPPTETNTEDKKPDVKPVKIEKECTEKESSRSSSAEEVEEKEEKQQQQVEEQEEKQEKEEEKQEKQQQQQVEEQEEKQEKEEEKQEKQQQVEEQEEKQEKEEEKQQQQQVEEKEEKQEKPQQQQQQEEEEKQEKPPQQQQQQQQQEEEEEKYDPDLDLEVDFPQESATVVEGMEGDSGSSLPPAPAEEKPEPEEPLPALRPQPRRQVQRQKLNSSATPGRQLERPVTAVHVKGNKRQAVEESSGPTSSSSSSSSTTTHRNKPCGGRSLPLKARYGIHAWKRWALSASEQVENGKGKGGSKPARSKSNLLSLSSEELNTSLSQFVREVCRPNGERYSPDSVLYLCLGIQQHLHTKGRKDDLFSDPCYQQFGEELNKVLKDWKPAVLPDGSLWGRVEEQSLWSGGQLGEHSPAALLRSLVYLNTKYFGLQTVEQHLRLSFADVYGPDAVHPVTKEKSVCVRVPSISQGHHVRTESRKRKRKSDDGDQDDDSGGSAVGCPLKKHESRLYDLYRSKCPQLLRDRLDVFYVQPDPACDPEGPLWFSSAPLERRLLESLLTRVLLIRDIYIDKQRPDEGGAAAEGD